MIAPRSTRRQRGEASETLNVPPLPAPSARIAPVPRERRNEVGDRTPRSTARARRHGCRSRTENKLWALDGLCFVKVEQESSASKPRDRDRHRRAKTPAAASVATRLEPDPKGSP
jgi:hypothetical protein